MLIRTNKHILRFVWCALQSFLAKTAVTTLRGRAPPRVAEIKTDFQEVHGANDVSLMVTVTEKDISSISLRIPRLMAQQHFDFKGRRFFVLDLRGKEPSNSLLDVIQTSIRRGDMDSWVAVNYSDAYVSKVGGPATWAGGHKGRLVYFFMLDWSPTRYVVHYDLDIALWAKPGYSWISAGVQILQNNERILEVQPPLPDYNALGATSGWTTNFTCQGANFITGRYYLMDRLRYLKLHQQSNSSASEPMPFGCEISGPQAWEVQTSCAACQAGYQRADLLDSTSSWVLHFPHKPTADLRQVLDVLVAKGQAVQDSFQPFNAAELGLWLQRLPANLPQTHHTQNAQKVSHS